MYLRAHSLVQQPLRIIEKEIQMCLTGGEEAICYLGSTTIRGLNQASGRDTVPGDLWLLKCFSGGLPTPDVGHISLFTYSLLSLSAVMLNVLLIVALSPPVSRGRPIARKASGLICRTLRIIGIVVYNISHRLGPMDLYNKVPIGPCKGRGAVE